jgi:hypothetical protein
MTLPEDESMVAIALPELLHFPPAVASPSVTAEPRQTLCVPVMDNGKGLTVTVAYAAQPDPREKVMGAVPNATPPTVPEREPIVAMPGLPLIQVPPPPSSSVVVLPRQTCRLPVIGGGAVLTVTMVVTEHPVDNV